MGHMEPGIPPHPHPHPIQLWGGILLPTLLPLPLPVGTGPVARGGRCLELGRDLGVLAWGPEDPGYLQACRALMIAALVLGFLGLAAGAVGLRCTRVAEGSPGFKARMAVAAGALLLLAGLCGMVALSWYAFNITRDFFDPLYPGTKYEIGPALYLGWSGALLAMVGGGCLLGSCRAAHGPQDKSYSYSYHHGAPAPATGASAASSMGRYGKNAYV